MRRMVVEGRKDLEAVETVLESGVVSDGKVQDIHISVASASSDRLACKGFRRLAMRNFGVYVFRASKSVLSVQPSLLTVMSILRLCPAMSACSGSDR